MRWYCEIVSKLISIDNKADIPPGIGMRDHFCRFLSTFQHSYLSESDFFTSRKKFFHFAMSQCVTPLSDRHVLQQHHKSQVLIFHTGYRNRVIKFQVTTKKESIVNVIIYIRPPASLQQTSSRGNEGRNKRWENSRWPRWLSALHQVLQKLPFGKGNVGVKSRTLSRATK